MVMEVSLTVIQVNVRLGQANLFAHVAFSVGHVWLFTKWLFNLVSINVNVIISVLC